MQNVGQSENRNIDKVNVQLDVVKSSTPQSSASSPAKSETETYSGAPAKYMTDSSESEDDSVSEAEMEEEGSGTEPSKFLLSHDDPERAVDPEMQARLEALLEAAGIGKLSGEGKQLADPEVLRRLTSSVSCALDEAAAALTRMRSDQPAPIHRHHHPDKNFSQQCGSTATGTTPTVATPAGAPAPAPVAVGVDGLPTLAEACSDGDVGTVKKLLTEGRSVHETTEEGESLLSLACSAGYYELAQVLLAMHASVEDRGIKGDCTPLMEAASAGHVDIVRLLVAHGADCNAVSGSGNTPLMYACAGGHEECVRALLDNGANVEDHNENGHTPLMEAASAGHVGVAKILLEHGAGINTHSNEFKESALTLACYKGHLDMVRFLLAAGADREHKTDEMHTALMEASMDGHVEVARLLLDSGAQVNMPTDSFESPLTLAACGGHVELAMLLLERGANIEEVNDEGYTPLMEAAREGHEEMVALLLGQGAQINAQTDETQETALTLACCGGFLEVADFLIKAGADAELGASTPLMEASQEGHLELVRYLISAGADVHAQTQTGDTALTYACENGHTDVAETLLRAGAHLEHESEGGRTPLMKACRAGHVCTVQFLIGKGADVNRMTANCDHTPLSLACAGGHVDVVKYLLACDADPFRKLRDNSTTLIEAAKGGHTAVVQLLLDYPHSVMMTRAGSNGCEDGAGGGCLSAAQAAALGLAHAPSPAAPAARALLPHHPHVTSHAPGHLTPHPAHAAPQPAPAPAPALVSTQSLPDTFPKLYVDPSERPPCQCPPKPTGHSAPATPNPVSSQAQTLPDSFAKVYLDERGVVSGRKKAGGAPPAPAPAPTPTPIPAPAPVLAPAPAPAPGTKHKCARKQRSAPPHSDHHLPPPPDILDDTIYQHNMAKVSLPPGFTWKDVNVKKNKIIDPPKNKCKRGESCHRDALPESDRSLLELADPAGPPTLATSALQALDLQFCAQGVTTIYPPKSPPYPPPQQLFPVQQLTTNLSQHQLQELQQQQLAQLAAQQQLHQLKHKPTQQQLQQQYKSGTELQAADDGSGCTGGAVEARELGAVLAYLQREVPSLVALPPNELRSLVLQVMQQKTHEILSAKCEGGDGEGADPECKTRQLLEAAEQALSADWAARPDHHHHTRPHHHHRGDFAPQVGNGCQYRVRATSPGVLADHPLVMARDVPDPRIICDPTEPHFALPPPTMSYDEYRSSASYTPPQPPQVPQPQPLPQPQPPPQPQPQPQPHTKREQHHSNAAKKKGRLAGRSRGAGASAGVEGAGACAAPPVAYSAMDVDGATDSNHDTALTLACAGGHEELVELLLSRGASIEHRDKKGFTPLILAATAGHEKIVEILLNHSADIEAQSERTKDTPLSLACSGGRYEVVELILSRGANKEHRNVSDYTPLSLAASGGYVNIIRLLLTHQAEINSRTGSKLGISPLMLAAMNGHTAAVRLLLDCGSDINAQIETNRNTALTLACFQGRHEVVSLLLDRKANVEHRAKTGLTPLMEAASGGYVEVGRVLLDKGADVNAPPVPSSRDTALTIAADKGHTKFVELLLQRRAAVEVKNKKGNSPLWLAANGGHLAVVEMLYAAGADIDSQDNRKVSCLMAAFRKGHTKVVKWMVGVVTQFPSDQEMTRYICTISDKELLEKCQECVRVIRAAKETQAARANQNATILLEELDAERCREENRRQAAARRRERKKKKKLEKKSDKYSDIQSTEQEEKRKAVDPEKGSLYGDKPEEEESVEGDDEPQAKEEGDSGIDANSQGSCSSSDVKAVPAQSAKVKKKKREDKSLPPPPPAPAPAKKLTEKTKPKLETKLEKESTPKPELPKKQDKENVSPPSPPPVTVAKPPPPAPALAPLERRLPDKKDKKTEEDSPKSITVPNVKYGNNSRKSLVFESTRLNMEKDDIDTTEKNKKSHVNQWEVDGKITSPKGATATRREEGWKEVVRKSSVQTLSTLEPGCKKVSVASHAISRVIGRAGTNINAIRAATGAHIEVDKQSKGQGERIITIKGSAEATKQAASLIASMIRDPEADIAMLLPRTKPPPPQPPPAQPKPPKQPQLKVGHTVTPVAVSVRAAVGTRPPAKSTHLPAPRVAAPRLSTTHLLTAVEKRPVSTPTVIPSSASVVGAVSKSGVSYTGAIVGARSHTFAAKLTASSGSVSVPPPPPPPADKPRPVQVSSSAGPASPPEARDPSPSGAPPPAPALPDDVDKQRLPERNMQLSPDNTSSWNPSEESSANPTTALHINTTPQSSSSSGSGGAPEYSLFKDLSGAASMWGAGDAHHNVDLPPPQVDASKAPGYRGGGGGCSPCSRASSHGSTPPPAYAPHHAPPPPYHQPLPIGNNVNSMDMSGLSRNGPMYQDNSRNGHNMMMSSGVNMSSASLGLGYVGVESVSRLNPRAPDFAQRHPLMHKHNQQMFTGTNNSGNLSNLLMSSYQQPMSQSPKAMPHTPQPHHPYQSLLERGGGGAGGAAGWGEEEERKPRPIGTERAWTRAAADQLHHLPHLDHDRYQGMSGMGGAMEGAYGGAGAGAGAGGAAAAALSLMHALPLQFLPGAPAPQPERDHPHWDPAHHHHNTQDKQTWNKWSH